VEYVQDMFWGNANVKAEQVRPVPEVEARPTSSKAYSKAAKASKGGATSAKSSKSKKSGKSTKKSYSGKEHATVWAVPNAIMRKQKEPTKTRVRNEDDLLRGNGKS